MSPRNQQVSQALNAARQFLMTLLHRAGTIAIGDEEVVLPTGLCTGEEVRVSQNGTRLRAHAAVRSGIPTGTVFLATGVAEDSANALTEPTVEVHKP